MKNKLSFISIFTLCIALSLTACGGKQASNTDSKNTQTEAGSEASGKSDSRLDDLYQQENQLFADHADAWNKAFGMMNKSDADPNGNYADYLAGTVESNKDSFTDDELKTLNADIETIRKIEEQIAELENKNTSSDDNKNKTQIYWLHFTGSDVKNTLRKYGFTDNKRVFNVGTSLEYEQVFKRIITELQRCQDNYEEMLMLLLRHLLIIFNRKITTEHVIRNEFLDSQMDTAITYFNTNYNRAINVEEYASSIGMSISWFIRSFKKYTGSTPIQFITSLRMTNAQVLLETTSYSINEIAGIVGYNNPLYFSRLFHKQKGCSPSEYRARNT